MIDVSDPAALRAEAERRRRLRDGGTMVFGDPAPDPAPAITERDARVLEKSEQHEVRKRFIVCGFKVYNLSQAREAKQTPGLADMWLVHRSLPIALWWETKRQLGGVFSADQKTFAAECTRCNVGYQAGDRNDAERYLVTIGRAQILGGTFEPIPSDDLPF